VFDVGEYQCVRGSQLLAFVVIVKTEVVCARKWGIWKRSRQLQGSKIVEGHRIEVEVQELVFGRDKCRHARGVPGFARTLVQPVKSVYESLKNIKQ
jgi:hypothetical protein